MKKFLFIVFVLLSSIPIFAQTYVNMDGTIDSVRNCNLFVYDNGGLTGQYANNQNEMLTIYSNDPTNNAVLISVSGVDIDPSDTLYIFDGITDNPANLLGKLNNSNVQFQSLPHFSATIQNATGALTLKFVSDNENAGDGFTVEVECTAPCQRINILFDSIQSSHIPHFEDDGYLYIDVCPYDTVHLVAHGDYVDNGYSYNQSDNLSRFEWDFDLEIIDSVGLSAIDYYFTPGRGYDFVLNIIDQTGCQSLIPYTFRVRTSKNPIRDVAHFDPVCSGAELSLQTGYDNLSSIQLDSVGSEQITSLSVLDTIFLPDGISCPPYGYYYRSTVNFTSFSPSATITSGNDILYVRIKIEHSAIEDIRISLVCPNGSSCKIVPDYQYDGWGGLPHNYFRLNLGLAWRPDVMNTCNASQNNMGQAWNYIWSNNTQLGYQYAGGTYGYCYEGANVSTTPNPHWDDGSTSYTIDSSDQSTMTQIYHPLQNFSGMVGCPLNGSWYIEIQDMWNNDNGFLHEWEMALDPNLLPQSWSYSVNVDTVIYSGPGVDGNSIFPPQAGTFNYIATVIDEFGCEYDTNFTIDVVQSPQPDLVDDPKLCSGEMIMLNSGISADSASYLWNTGATTEDIMVVTAGTYIVKVFISNSDSSLVCTGNDTTIVTINPQPHAYFEADVTEGCSPLKIQFTNNSIPDSIGLNYQWNIYNFDGALVFSSTLQNPSFEIEGHGSFHVQLIITSDQGCVDSLMKWNYLTVYPQPVAEFSFVPEISLMSESDGIVTFTNYCDSTIYMNDPEVNWHWDFGDDNTENEVWSPTHTFDTWGDYDVTFLVETSYGCMSQITHTVVLEDKLIFPNVITPDGDGKNDVFAVRNLSTDINPEDPDNYRTNSLQIYDRWGKKVYEVEDYDTYQRDEEAIVYGEKYFDAEGLSDGEYYFVFSYKGKTGDVKYSGSLLITRKK